MRHRVLAGVLAAGVALVLAGPATSEAGHRRSYGRGHGRSWHGRPYVRPHVSFAYRSYAPYRSYGYGGYGYSPYGYHGYDRYYSGASYSDPYCSRPSYAGGYYAYGQPYYRRPAFGPRVYYGRRPFYRGYRGRPFISVRVGF